MAVSRLASKAPSATAPPVCTASSDMPALANSRTSRLASTPNPSASTA
ncbi:Uncharacterised protein [Bordetella pertussis]|nr:Uncharacterised protein [Bordetella pertussis]